MNNNPFLSVVKCIRDDNKPNASYRLGNVVSVNPFTVDVAGTNQDISAFLKNDMLTPFNIGDRLFLVPIEDEQRYIIVCKVVSV